MEVEVEIDIESCCKRILAQRSKQKKASETVLFRDEREKVCARDTAVSKSSTKAARTRIAQRDLGHCWHKIHWIAASCVWGWMIVCVYSLTNARVPAAATNYYNPSKLTCINFISCLPEQESYASDHV